MNVFIHAAHAQAFELLNPPSLGLDGLVKIHAFVEVVTQGDAHNPQSTGPQMFFNIFNYSGDVAFVDVFHDFPGGDDIKLEPLFTRRKFTQHLKWHGNVGGEEVFSDRAPFGAAQFFGLE